MAPGPCTSFRYSGTAQTTSRLLSRYSQITTIKEAISLAHLLTSGDRRRGQAGSRRVVVAIPDLQEHKFSDGGARFMFASELFDLAALTAAGVDHVQSMLDDMGVGLQAPGRGKTTWLRSPVSVTRGCSSTQVAELRSMLRPYRFVAMLSYDDFALQTHKLAGTLLSDCGADLCCEAYKTRSPLFHKSELIYGLAEDFVGKAIGKGKPFIAAHIRPMPDPCVVLWQSPNENLDPKQLEDTCRTDFMYYSLLAMVEEAVAATATVFLGSGESSMTGMIVQRTALAWRPSQRSPMALFPHCNSLSLELINDAPLLRLEERLRNRAAAGGDSEDEVDEPLWFGQDALARMALFGTAAETRARITELSISLSYHGERPALDVASVLAALAPELSALQSITFEGEADPIGMGPGDHVRSALLHAALSTHAPRLHKLVLPSAPGMLRGVGSLAAGCVCLKELWLPLFVNDMPAESLGPVLLRAEELVASVPLHAADEAAGAGADGSWPRTPHAHFPPMVAEFEPLPGRIVCVKTDDEFATCVETDFGPAALDRLAGVLVAAVQSLPLRCGLSRLHLRTYALSARALRLRAAAGGEGPQQELEQQGGFGDGATTLARCLGLGGRLPLLAECAELDFLDASTAVSPAAVCAVLRVLGLPADQLCLHHGTWWQSTAQPIGGGNQTVGTAARLLQLVGQCGSPLHAAALAEAVKSTAAATGGGFAAAVIPDGITDAVPYPGRSTDMGRLNAPG
eukprot:XP_001696009.1 predicted protein [Chlamydomonas reinhardtii]